MRQLLLMLFGALAVAAAALFVLSRNINEAGWLKVAGSRPGASPSQQAGSEAKEENTPPAEGAAAPEQGKPAPPSAQITLPGPLGALSFGMVPSAVARLFPPAWRKETRRTLTLVHYPDKSRRKQYRFEFSANALTLIEVRVEPDKARELNALYHGMQEEANKMYGPSRGKSSATWTDGRVTARILKGSDYVTMLFRPHK